MGLFDKIKKSFKSSEHNNDNVEKYEKNNADNDNYNSNERNFKYLDKLIHSGKKEIVLDSDIILSDNEKSKYYEGILLDIDDITIDGAGHRIDACGQVRVFSSIAKNITIKNITIENAFYDGYGAGIRMEGGSIRVIESIFKNNNSKGPGTAISNIEGELEVAQCTFTNNRGGGAIQNYDKLKVSQSTFENNFAEGGGAIGNGYEAEMSISNCRFIKNSSLGGMYGGGGAIENGNNTRTTISNCEFIENTSKSGGAIFNWGELTIKESSLINNSSEEEHGIIFNKKGHIKLLNCKISNNKAPNIIFNNDSVEIYDSSFEQNMARNIILNECERAYLAILYGHIIDNDIARSVVYNNGKSAIIEKTSFENNLHNNDSFNIINLTEMTLNNPKINDSGKTICNKGHIIIRNSSPKLLNIISGEGKITSIGGGFIPPEVSDFGHLDKLIHESDSLEIILDEDIKFEPYEIDYYEGGIVLDIDDLVIDGNGKTIDGGGKSRIFIITGKNITLKNITFKNGYSHKNYDIPLNSNGGALKANYNSDLTIKNCKFIKNTSEDSGGAISNLGKLSLIQTLINENRTSNEGGAIYNKSDLFIQESSLSANTTKDFGGISEYGGAISNSGNLCIVDSRLNDNRSEIGGAIYNEGSDSKLAIYKSQLLNNSTEYSGGAIYLKEGHLELGDCDFSENTSKQFGGAIMNYGEVNISNSNLNGNLAKYSGGAIDNRSKLIISQSILNKNSTNDSGGAIFNSNGDLTISDSILAENSAEDDGGAIYSTGELRIKDSKINDNIAQKGSAAIFNGEKRLFHSENCKFKNNKPKNVKSIR